MHVVIDIPKKLYDRYKEKDHIKRCDIDEFEKALDKCIILPKGHGRLIDESKIEKCYMLPINCIGVKDLITDAPTIIEAESEE